MNRPGRNKARHILLRKALQAYWRMSRPLTIGAQGLILDSDDRVLLIRHTYRAGWHFPGGGVEKNETIASALLREIAEEAGVIGVEPPELFGVYGNFQAFPSDHVALYVVRSWRQKDGVVPNREVREAMFFSPDALPEDTIDPVRRRLREFFDGADRSEFW